MRTGAVYAIHVEPFCFENVFYVGRAGACNTAEASMIGRWKDHRRHIGVDDSGQVMVNWTPRRGPRRWTRSYRRLRELMLANPTRRLGVHLLEKVEIESSDDLDLLIQEARWKEFFEEELGFELFGVIKGLENTARDREARNRAISAAKKGVPKTPAERAAMTNNPRHGMKNPEIALRVTAVLRARQTGAYRPVEQQRETARAREASRTFEQRSQQRLKAAETRRATGIDRVAARKAAKTMRRKRHRTDQITNQPDGSSEISNRKPMTQDRFP